MENFLTIWKKEEEIAHIHGWDFSHIHGRYEEENDLPWDYEKIVRENLSDDLKICDYDTGGGEFLLSLRHPYENTAATEGFPPNVELCKETLLPLGIDFKPCDYPEPLPFADGSFDLFLNRHGAMDEKEFARVLKPGGLFITEQVGGDNDHDLTGFVLPDTLIAFPHNMLPEKVMKLQEAGFEILRAEDAYRPIRFFDVGAFVWFAHIIEWEFPGFSVEKCGDKLLEMQKIIEEKGEFSGTIHRFLIVARKKQ